LTGTSPVSKEAYIKVYGIRGRFFANLGGTAGVKALVPDFSGARAFFILFFKIKLRSEDDDRVHTAMARLFTRPISKSTQLHF